MPGQPHSLVDIHRTPQATAERTKNNLRSVPRPRFFGLGFFRDLPSNMLTVHRHQRLKESSSCTLRTRQDAAHHKPSPAKSTSTAQCQLRQTRCLPHSKETDKSVKVRDIPNISIQVLKHWNCTDPLFTPSTDRFVLFPIRYPEVRRMLSEKPRTVLNRNRFGGCTRKLKRRSGRLKRSTYPKTYWIGKRD